MLFDRRRRTDPPAVVPVRFCRSHARGVRLSSLVCSGVMPPVVISLSVLSLLVASAGLFFPALVVLCGLWL